MAGTRVTHWLVAALAGAVLLPNLGGSPLWDEDEPLNAACSLAMHASGDWVVPTFNGRLRVEKPALVNWVHLAGFAVAGLNETGARLGSALLTVGTCLLTCDIARRLFDPGVARWAGVVMATFLWTGIAGRAATPDAPLGFCTTLALAAFVRGLVGNDGMVRAGRVSVSAAVATGVAAGAAILAKGPIGLLLPLGAFGLFAGWTALAGGRGHRPSMAMQAAWHDARLGTIVGTALLVAAPWYVAVTLRTDGEWLRGFLFVHNVGRFAAPMEGHSGSTLTYYPGVLLVGTFPWSIGWIPAVLHALRIGGGTRPGAVGIRLLAAWIAAWVVPLSCAGTKLPGYVWPVYPALACLTGLFVADWLRRPETAADRWMRVAWACLAATGAALAAGLPVATRQLAAGSPWLGLIGFVPLVGAAAAWVCQSRGRRDTAASAWAATAAATVACLVGIAPAAASRHAGVRHLVATPSDRPAAPILLYRAPPSAVFYAGRLAPGGRVPEARSPEALAELLASHAGAHVVVDARFADSIRGTMPADYRELRRASVLPSGRNLLLFGPAAACAQKPAGPSPVLAAHVGPRPDS